MSEQTTKKAAIEPTEFSFAEWIAGAHKPTRSSTVHQRGDLIAELDRLQEKIEIAEMTPAEERSVEDLSADTLRAQYAEIAQQFHDSGLLVKTSGHTKDEQLDISEALDEKLKEQYPEEDESPEALKARGRSDRTLTYWLLADAVQEPKLTVEQLQQLHSIVGEAQFERIVNDYKLASQSLNEPDADFLPKHSTTQETDA